MIRVAALLLALAASLFAAETRAEYVQAVEFPYYLYPRTLWERELVWLKNIGVQTVGFSIPWNFHQTPSGETDLTGATSPRRDLVGFVRLLRRLGLRAWVRPLPPVPGLLNNGGRPEPAQQRAWLKQLEQLLATQTTSHGGPIAYVEGRSLAIEAAVPPAPLVSVSASDPAALARSRDAISIGHGTLLWTGVEDAVYPAGWAADPSSLLRPGAVGLAGDERSGTTALRRDAALLRGWSRLLGAMKPVVVPKPAAGKLPDGVSVAELVSPAASAVSLTNSGPKPFADDVRVRDPGSGKVLVVPGVSVAPGQSLWLPLSASLGPNGLCRECTSFAGTEHIVYATAELLSIEFENGILAMEFAAPQAGEVILQLARRPVGPFLAAGKPTDFDWDEHALRARLRIPANQQPGNRVRIGIAIEAPDTSAFFNELRRLVSGRGNTISTIYSSAEVAARSRLRLPEGFSATAKTKSPNEIDYEITVPADALHGDFVNLAIEADGVPLGRARVQLFRPASIHLAQPLQLHFGSAAALTTDPPISVGANVELTVRNNSMQIQTYRLEPSGEGLEFFPPNIEVSVGPTDERRIEFRVFGKQTGLCDWTLRVKNGADMTMPMRLLQVPRAQTVAWTADLDGDGSPEWVLESPKVRAIFSTQDGGRWMELTWKDTGVNFLPEGGVFAQVGGVEVHASGNTLEFTGKGWKRTVSLTDIALTIEQSIPLSAQIPAGEKRGNTTLTVSRPTSMRVVYAFQ